MKETPGITFFRRTSGKKIFLIEFKSSEELQEKSFSRVSQEKYRTLRKMFLRETSGEMYSKVTSGNTLFKRTSGRMFFRRISERTIP